LTIYPTCRLIVEFFRGDKARGLIWSVEKVVTVAGREMDYLAGFTLPMFFSLVLMAAAGYGWYRVFRYGRLVEEEAVEAETETVAAAPPERAAP